MEQAGQAVDATLLDPVLDVVALECFVTERILGQGVHIFQIFMSRRYCWRRLHVL